MPGPARQQKRAEREVSSLREGKIRETMVFWPFTYIYISKYAYGQKCGKLGFGASIRRKSTICRGCWVAWAFSQTKSNWWTIWRPTMQVFEAILGWLVGGLERFLFFHLFIIPTYPNCPNWRSHIFQRGGEKPPSRWVLVISTDGTSRRSRRGPFLGMASHGPHRHGSSKFRGALKATAA